MELINATRFQAAGTIGTDPSALSSNAAGRETPRIGIECFVAGNPYDEVPYKSFPIEWTAPERLVLASLLHGGPQPTLTAYRVLELGCGDGSNLLPLAYYRRHATFVGLDGARSQIEVANAHKHELDLSNIDFIHEEFSAADRRLEGDFNFIIAHGVLSWVPHRVRDGLLSLCGRRLRRGGLLYLNYNARPGWNVRGMVRDFLCAQTAATTGLARRALLAKDVAAKVLTTMTASEHPYTRLMINEFQFVCESDVSYVAHEYLATDNHSYWRSDFLALAARHGLTYVADADFCYESGRVPEALPLQLREAQICGRDVEDTLDLLCYRQLHSPILTQGPWARQPLGVEEFANLLVASCLARSAPNDAGNPMFRHPSGYEVEAKEEAMATALDRLRPLWPRGLRVRDLFADVGRIAEDLKLLQRNGLIELRCPDGAEGPAISLEPLRRLENGKGGYFTTRYHTREAALT